MFFDMGDLFEKWQCETDLFAGWSLWLYGWKVWISTTEDTIFNAQKSHKNND